MKDLVYYVFWFFYVVGKVVDFLEELLFTEGSQGLWFPNSLLFILQSILN